MRISHELARNIAMRLTEKSKKALEQMRGEIDKLVIEEYSKKIPLQISNAAKYFPEWLQMTDSIAVSYGHKCGRAHYAHSSKKLITKAGRSELKPAASIKKKILQYNADQEKLKALQNETTRAIIALGTAKRVVEQFPEAAAFFKDKLPLAPLKTNISDLKAKLNQQ